MKIKNNSGKIIGLGKGVSLLPGATGELPTSMEKNPVILALLKKKMLTKVASTPKADK